MASKSKNLTVITSEFILSYPKLFKPEPYMENGKPKGDPVYSFEGLSEKDSLKEWLVENPESQEFEKVNIESVLVKLARDRWGDDFDVKQAVKLGALNWPFKSGDKKADEKGDRGEHYRNKKIWRAKAQAMINGTPNTPNLYDTDDQGELVRLVRGTPSAEEKIQSLFYGGAICSAELVASAGEAGTNKYVTFYVNSVIFEKEGKRLGTGSAVERMRGVRGSAVDYDPTEGMEDDLDDEIPF